MAHLDGRVPNLSADEQADKVYSRGKRWARRNNYRLDRDAIDRALKDGLTPLEFLMAVYRDPEIEMEFRVEAAKAAAPYVHRRMPATLEIRSFAQMTDEELMQLAGLAPASLSAPALPAPALEQ